MLRVFTHHAWSLYIHTVRMLQAFRPRRNEYTIHANDSGLIRRKCHANQTEGSSAALANAGLHKLWSGEN